MVVARQTGVPGLPPASIARRPDQSVPLRGDEARRFLTAGGIDLQLFRVEREGSFLNLKSGGSFDPEAFAHAGNPITAVGLVARKPREVIRVPDSGSLLSTRSAPDGTLVSRSIAEYLGETTPYAQVQPAKGERVYLRVRTASGEQDIELDPRLYAQRAPPETLRLTLSAGAIAP